MGKTKTAFVTGAPIEEKTGKAAYEERRKKKEEKLAKGQSSSGRKAQIAGVGLKGGERIKVVTGEIISEAPTEIPSAVSAKTPQPPRLRGKKYLALKAKIDRNKLYPIQEAIKLVKETSYSKFNGTMELHLLVKKSGITERVTLPHEAGKQKKVEIADEETLKKLNEGKIDFDVLLATSEMMPKLIPFAKILGPKGLMPNPKQGTLIKSAKDADLSAQAGKFSGNTITIKTEKEAPVIHTVVGKVDQNEKELEENVLTIINALDAKNVQKAYLTSTMSPSVKLALS